MRPEYLRMLAAILTAYTIIIAIGNQTYGAAARVGLRVEPASTPPRHPHPHGVTPAELAESGTDVA